jgi:hypothetical protein
MSARYGRTPGVKRRRKQGRKRVEGEEVGDNTYLRAIVTKGNFLPPTSSHDLPFLSALNHSSTFIPIPIPVTFFLPVGVVNKFANVLRASRVFVSFTFEDV